MAITVYTYNDKVLKNVATDKWLKKPDAPAGFVMDASNVANIGGNASGMYVSWEGPNYPSGYDGNGKRYLLVNNNSGSEVYSDFGLMYAPVVEAGGPTAISGTDITTIGQSEGTITANAAGAASGYGKYLNLLLKKNGGITLEEAQAYMTNVSITILDP